MTTAAKLKPASPYGLGRPHFTMCFAVVAGLAQFAPQQSMNTPIEFIFDEQQGVDADIGLFLSELRKNLHIEAPRLISDDPRFKSDATRLMHRCRQQICLPVICGASTKQEVDWT